MPPTTTAPTSRKHSNKPYDPSRSRNNSGLTEDKMEKKPEKQRSAAALPLPVDAAKSSRRISQDAERKEVEGRPGDGSAGSTRRKKKKNRHHSGSNIVSTAASQSLKEVTTGARNNFQLDKASQDTPTSIFKEEKPSIAPSSLHSTKSNPLSAREIVQSRLSGLPADDVKGVSHSKALAKKTSELDKLQSKMEKHKIESAKKEKELQKKIEELEEQVKVQKESEDAKDKRLEKQQESKMKLEEACQCGVCMDTLDDPHIVSCGHIACRKCLVQWFRTPGAYPTPLAEEPIRDDHDLSYHRKSCHVCRSVIIHRPTRLYFLGGILEPLGIDPQLPTPSQQFDGDPWKNIFPPERDTYKIFDESDRVSRCPACGTEIEDGVCAGCGVEFSDASGDEMGVDLNDNSDSDDDDSENDNGPPQLLGERTGNDMNRIRQILSGHGHRQTARRTGLTAAEFERRIQARLVDDEAGESSDDDDDFISGDEADQEEHTGRGGQVDEEEGTDLSAEDDEYLALRRRNRAHLEQLMTRGPTYQDIFGGDDESDDSNGQGSGEENSLMDVDEEEESVYEDSFIDDGSGDEEGDSHPGNQGGMSSDDDEDEDEEEEDVVGRELDQPDAEELRRRRVQTFSGRQPRRVVSNDQSTVPPPRARRPRRIAFSSDEE